MPYKIQTLQFITDIGISQKWDFANEILGLINTGILEPKKIWFSDEAHFWLSGQVNQQNYRFWGSSNPEFVNVRPFRPQKVTVWAVLCGLDVFRPIFFASIVKADAYEEVLGKSFYPQIRVLGMNTGGYWFIQDGAPLHQTGKVFDTINNVFGAQVIDYQYQNNHPGTLHWPSYSPDIILCNFYLWGHMKDIVYKKKPIDLNSLKKFITCITSLH